MWTAVAAFLSETTIGRGIRAACLGALGLAAVALAIYGAHVVGRWQGAADVQARWDSAAEAEATRYRAVRQAIDEISAQVTADVRSLVADLQISSQEAIRVAQDLDAEPAIVSAPSGVGNGAVATHSPTCPDRLRGLPRSLVRAIDKVR